MDAIENRKQLAIESTSFSCKKCEQDVEDHIELMNEACASTKEAIQGEAENLPQ
eukprot:gene19215-6498_t